MHHARDDRDLASCILQPAGHGLKLVGTLSRYPWEEKWENLRKPQVIVIGKNKSDSILDLFL